MSTNTQYRAQVGIPYGHLSEMIQWCTDYCQSNWKYQVLDYGGKDPGNYEFIFDDERDYVQFLMWKK